MWENSISPGDVLDDFAVDRNGILSKRLAEPKEFDDIQTAASGFDAPHKGMLPLQLLG
jgi:hypothetical protein